MVPDAASVSLSDRVLVAYSVAAVIPFTHAPDISGVLGALRMFCVVGENELYEQPQQQRIKEQHVLNKITSMSMSYAHGSSILMNCDTMSLVTSRAYSSINIRHHSAAKPPVETHAERKTAPRVVYSPSTRLGNATTPQRAVALRIAVRFLCKRGEIGIASRRLRIPNPESRIPRVLSPPPS